MLFRSKANPGKVNFASSGSGTTIHMSAELFKMLTGLDMVHVPYKGSAAALTDLIGGQVSVMFDNLPAAMPHIRSGKLRALAVTTAKRWAPAPDIPSVAESGYPGFDVYSWFAYFAPAGTPREAINRLAADIGRVVQMPEIRERFASLSLEPGGGTPEELAAYYQKEVVRWANVVKTSNIKSE